MSAGTDARPGTSRFAALPGLVLVGLLYGVVEFARQRWMAPSPPGIPGDSGGDPMAYLALGITVVGLPGLLVSLIVPRTVRRTAAYAAGLFPTAAVALGRIGEVEHWTWMLTAEGELRWAVPIVLAVIGAIAGGVVLARLDARWKRPPWVARGAFALALVAPIVLALRVDPAPEALPVHRGEPRPNLVLLTIDTLRADAVEHFDDAWPTRDVPRQVATTTWSTSSWTRPAMASLFSGLVPTGHGTDDERAPSTEVSWWIEDLRDAGYRTLAVVANPHLRRRFGFDRGFERFEHFGELEWLEPVARSFWAEWWHDRQGNERDNATADLLVPRAIRMLERDAGDGPWLLWVHLVDPHIPYHLRGDDGALLDPDPGRWIDPLREDMEGDLFRANWEAREGTAVTTGEARRALRRLYQTEVDFALDWSQRLLEAAARVSGDRDLLWLMSSDHGEEFWDDGGFEHGHTLHPSVTEVPLWIGGSTVVDATAVPKRLIDVGPWWLDRLDVEGFDPREGSGLLADDAVLEELALGRAATVESWLAEGLLYGPPRTWVRAPGFELERNDVTREIDFVGSPVDSTRARALLMQLDLWRERNASKGRAVDLSPDLVRQLRAIGYMQ